MYLAKLHQEADQLAATAERITIAAIDRDQISEAAPMLRALRSEIERIRNQIAWITRDTAWTYPMQSEWTN